jgi:peptidyl-prolyl cis-trans isomerase SurA
MPDPMPDLLAGRAPAPPRPAALSGRGTARAAVLVAMLLASCAGWIVPRSAGAAAPAAKPAAAPILKDRIVAVVDEDPILLSDIEREVGLGLVPRNPGESETAYRRRVLALLIDQRLRFHEIDRFGFVQVPVEQVEKNLEEIRSRFPSPAAFQQRLKELGLSENGLKQLITRQLMVLTYVDERLGPRVFVSLDDIKAYYRDVMVPELTKRHQPVPPLDDVRETIRQVLREQRLNQEIERWTEELRNKADIANYFDEGGKPLPPVVKTIGPKRPAH